MNFPFLLWLPLSLKFHLCLLQLKFPFVILKLAILTSVLIWECLKTAITNTLCSPPVQYLALMLHSWPSWQKRSISRSPERFDQSLILSPCIFTLNTILPAICLLVFPLSHRILHLSPHVVTTPKSVTLKGQPTLFQFSMAYQTQSTPSFHLTSEWRVHLGQFWAQSLLQRLLPSHWNSHCSAYPLSQAKYSNTAWHLQWSL